MSEIVKFPSGVIKGSEPLETAAELAYFARQLEKRAAAAGFAEAAMMLGCAALSLVDQFGPPPYRNKPTRRLTRPDARNGADTVR